MATDNAAAGIIYATSTITGTAANYVMTSSSQTILSVGGPVTSLVTGLGTGAMSGGTNASYALRGQNITIAGHGLPQSLKVTISSTTGNSALTYSTAAVGGTNVTLAFGAAVYVIPVDVNTIQLALTSTGAIQGVPITLTSSRTLTTADVWTVTASTAVGTAGYGFQQSDDGVNFWNVPAITSTTIADGGFIYPSSYTWVDFGNVSSKFLRFSVAPPATSGAIAVKAYIHGEKR